MANESWGEPWGDTHSHHLLSQSNQQVSLCWWQPTNVNSNTAWDVSSLYYNIYIKDWLSLQDMMFYQIWSMWLRTWISCSAVPEATKPWRRDSIDPGRFQFGALKGFKSPDEPTNTSKCAHWHATSDLVSASNGSQQWFQTSDDSEHSCVFLVLLNSSVRSQCISNNSGEGN